MASRSKHIDLGVLGEQLCEVAYEVHPALHGTPPEPKSVEVVSVRWLCELMPYIPSRYIADLEQELAQEET